MLLTSARQLIPEQTTAALIVHHPEAKYYAVRGEGRRAHRGSGHGGATTSAPIGTDAVVSNGTRTRERLWRA
ncbi:MAG: hypothetical protein IPK33_25615 [Gemmatimonadetes bacterium]|nr:hypothetical protein [Gemmatimonadota bacterium]